MNDLGDVVGFATLPNQPTEFRAFLYHAGQTTNLNDVLPANSGWVLTDAWDVNNAGVIVGVGNLNGERRAFMMIPTGATQVGANISVSSPVDLPGGASGDVTVSFDNIAVGGATSVTASATGPAIPSPVQ